jgi:hypothetical protein
VSPSLWARVVTGTDAGDSKCRNACFKLVQSKDSSSVVDVYYRSGIPLISFRFAIVKLDACLKIGAASATGGAAEKAKFDVSLAVRLMWHAAGALRPQPRMCNGRGV